MLLMVVKKALSQREIGALIYSYLTSPTSGSPLPYALASLKNLSIAVAELTLKHLGLFHLPAQTQEVNGR